ncbi:receptor expression-enhancing protein 2 [Drosophila ficusphila]|uniref:receptor expression-enhancing protein 2 n=1 Tax=Drosophila ficusphila TaxID=30025 RepID=UPI0007E71C8F|nr:receptor expression-enhancing protein 2 [Drosophila ficusphila]
MQIEMCIFSLVSRILFFVYGTLGPAWHTYKTLNSGDDEFLGWVKYWIVYAFLVTFEVLADAFLSWMPLYMPTKFLLVLWIVLSAPGANVWIFDAILRPVLAKRQEQIDHFLHRGKDKLLSDVFAGMSQMVVRSRTVAMPFVSHLLTRSTTSLPPPKDSGVAADLPGGVAARVSEDSDSASASIGNFAQTRSSYSSPAGSSIILNDDEEIHVEASKATTHLHAHPSLSELARKNNIMSLEPSDILSRRIQRKPKMTKTSADESATISKTKQPAQKEELHDDVEDLLAKSQIETAGQDVRQQRQSVNRRRLTLANS